MSRNLSGAGSLESVGSAALSAGPSPTELPPPANFRTWKNGFRQAMHGAGLATAIAVSIKAGHLLKASISNQYGWILMGLGVALAAFSLISYARLANYRATGNSAVELNSTEMWKQMVKDLGWAFLGAISGIALNVVTANALFFEAAKEGANAWHFLDPRNALQFMNEAGGSLALAEEATMLATGIGLGTGAAGAAMTAGGPLYLLGSKLKAAAESIKGRLSLEVVQATDEPTAPSASPEQKERWNQAAFVPTKDEYGNDDLDTRTYLDRTKILKQEEEYAIHHLLQENSTDKKHVSETVHKELTCMILLNKDSLAIEETKSLEDTLVGRANDLLKKDPTDNEARKLELQHGFSNCILDIERYFEKFRENEDLRAKLNDLKDARPFPIMLSSPIMLSRYRCFYTEAGLDASQQPGNEEGVTLAQEFATGVQKDLKDKKYIDFMAETQTQLHRDMTSLAGGIMTFEVVDIDGISTPIEVLVDRKLQKGDTRCLAEGAWSGELRSFLKTYKIPTNILGAIGLPVPIESNAIEVSFGKTTKAPDNNNNNPLLIEMGETYQQYAQTTEHKTNAAKLTFKVQLNENKEACRVTLTRHDFNLKYDMIFTDSNTNKSFDPPLFTTRETISTFNVKSDKPGDTVGLELTHFHQTFKMEETNYSDADPLSLTPYGKITLDWTHSEAVVDATIA